MSLVTYQVEPWPEIAEQLKAMFPRHWEEVAINRDKIVLDPDYAEYDRQHAGGVLHILTARADGKIVGYHVSFVRPHLHYKTSLSAIVDIYYVAPEHRKGRMGIELFKEAEAALKRRGVQKIFTATKKHLDMTKVFEHLGYGVTETLLTKYIGD